MKLKKACELLGLLDIALAHANVWYISTPSYDQLEKFKDRSKKIFKNLATIIHPDAGGSKEDFQLLVEACEIISKCEVYDIINLLKETQIKYNPGDTQCKSCSKWNVVVNTCMTTICSGFNQLPNTILKTAKNVA